MAKSRILSVSCAVSRIRITLLPNHPPSSSYHFIPISNFSSKPPASELIAPSAFPPAMDVNTIPVVSTFANPFDNLPQPSSNGGGKPIALWPGMYHSPVTSALWEARSKIFDNMLHPPKDAPPQTQLLTKTPAQSRTSILYNFSSDYILREQYRDPWNEVRIGKLLEDLDALAGTISVKHCSDDDCATRPLLLVTASVDRIVLKKPISVDVDLKIVGSAIWVGRSSIEIQLEVIQPATGTPIQIFELAFSTSYAFSGSVPSFLEVDHVDFLRPVDVGDFLRLKSCILYTELENPDEPLINVEVVAHVTKPELRLSEVTNTFYFTFTVRPEAKATKNGNTLRNVVPTTEEEARLILERKDAEALHLV
ncbi:Acyl-coenzyme A thioesterase 2, chloroplastic [Linum perenne]